MTHETSIVKSSGDSIEPHSGASKSPLDMSRFQFKETIVELDGTGAWTLDGKVAMAFGPGASQIGARAGVSITKPLKVMVGNNERDNPYLEHDNNGQPAILWIRKIGVYLDKHGLIRYVDLTDRIDIKAYVAERATKLVNRVDNQGNSIIGNSGRYCTKTQAEQWNASSKEPGQDVWWFVPTQGDEIGVAFNLADKVYLVNKFQEEIIHIKKTILRRFETATDRRVIFSLLPESLKTTDMKASYDQKYKKWTLAYARFTVDSPEGHGFELGIFQQIARALKEDNPEMRERAFAAFKKMSGFDETTIKEMPADNTPSPTEITPEWEPSEDSETSDDSEELVDDEEGPAPELTPLPAGAISMKDFRAYIKAEVPKLNAEQLQGLTDIYGKDSGFHQFKGKEMGQKIRRFFIEIAGQEEPPESGEVTPDMMRKHIGEQLAENSQKITDILYARYGEEWTLDELSDIEISEIYNELYK